MRTSYDLQDRSARMCTPFQNPYFNPKYFISHSIGRTFYTDYSKKSVKFLTEKVEEQKAAREGFHLWTPFLNEFITLVMNSWYDCTKSAKKIINASLPQVEKVR